jgi:hypothetical protein
MSEKLIILDPSSLKVLNKRTRKKRNGDNNNPGKIKVRAPKKEKKVSTIKRNLLNLIRENQESRLKHELKIPMIENALLLTPPKSDFEESVHFFSSLPNNKQTANKPVNNQTIKSYNHHPKINIHSFLPAAETMTAPPPSTMPVFQLGIPAPPPWGNLKQGSKPTYRVWKNTTAKQFMPQHQQPLRRTIVEEEIPSLVQANYATQLNEKIKELSEREQYKLQKTQLLKPGIKNKPKRQKRIVRRTFRIGKSKINPLISVLVSNKTLRNEANLKKIALKETPMPEVKKYLRKHGFVKVGTSTPNDILRQMYENVRMVCGEVHNHNPDNLLYNYFNDGND